jgi:NADH dehydrogenase
VQPVFVEDVAEIAVNAAHRNEDAIVDAVGPDTYTFDELVRLIADKIRSKARIVHLSPSLALLLSRMAGYLVNDVMLTHDEVEGLMANLLVSDGPPTGQTRLGDWLDENADSVGAKYACELSRHYR